MTPRTAKNDRISCNTTDRQKQASCFENIGCEPWHCSAKESKATAVGSTTKLLLFSGFKGPSIALLCLLSCVSLFLYLACLLGVWGRGPLARRPTPSVLSLSLSFARAADEGCPSPLSLSLSLSVRGLRWVGLWQRLWETGSAGRLRPLHLFCLACHFAVLSDELPPWYSFGPLVASAATAASSELEASSCTFEKTEHRLHALHHFTPYTRKPDVGKHICCHVPRCVDTTQVQVVKLTTC